MVRVQKIIIEFVAFNASNDGMCDGAGVSLYIAALLNLVLGLIVMAFAQT